MSEWREADSDGCTWFPDGCWLTCCHEHDRRYHRGGPLWKRQQADLKFMCCVISRVETVISEWFNWLQPRRYMRWLALPGTIVLCLAFLLLGVVMYLGVRIGGSPLLHDRGWQWGPDPDEKTDDVEKNIPD